VSTHVVPDGQHVNPFEQQVASGHGQHLRLSGFEFKRVTSVRLSREAQPSW
jgi:hypothetical protein